MPKKPKCKLCGERHWVYEEHNLGVTKPNEPLESVTPDRNVTKPKPVTFSKRGGVRSGSGRSRLHESNAARQKAYRGRK